MHDETPRVPSLLDNHSQNIRSVFQENRKNSVKVSRSGVYGVALRSRGPSVWAGVRLPFAFIQG